MTSRGWYKQLGCWFHFVGEQSPGVKDTRQKQNEESDFRYIKFGCLLGSQESS